MLLLSSSRFVEFSRIEHILNAGMDTYSSTHTTLSFPPSPPATSPGVSSGRGPGYLIPRPRRGRLAKRYKGSDRTFFSKIVFVNVFAIERAAWPGVYMRGVMEVPYVALHAYDVQGVGHDAAVVDTGR